MLRYALVTPARDECPNLERLSAAIIAQRHLPTAWIIVDDGSEDGTAQLAAALHAEHHWIHGTTPPPAQGRIADGRRLARDLDAFKHGIRTLPEPVDVVVKVDADTSFDSEYFAALLAHFERDPTLGIAGGACYELERGAWVRRKVQPTHPRGASRAYRWALVPDLLELAPRMGWDGLDEVKAQLRGYRSATILELGFRHHRAVGGREMTRLHHQAAQGRAAYYMGYRPAYLLLRTVYRTVTEPSALGMIWGYLRAAVERAERCSDRAAVAHLRDGQRLRRVLRQGTPP